MTFIRSHDVKEKQIAGELALYVGEHRSIHVLSPTARFLWESLAEPLTFDELLFVLTEAFGGDEDGEPTEDILRKDLRDTLDQFLALGILDTQASGDANPVS